jgi:hypothetical protein
MRFLACAIIAILATSVVADKLVEMEVAELNEHDEVVAVRHQMVLLFHIFTFTPII